MDEEAALALLSALGSPFKVDLELCQATQMVFEKVKGLKWGNAGKVEVQSSSLRKIDSLNF